MTGNWTVKNEDIEEVGNQKEFIPDFCVGYLYLTTPKIGAALVQVAHSLYSSAPQENNLIEDYLVTGYLRERLPWAKLSLLENTGMRAWLWNQAFSCCPWLSFFNNFFLNPIVLSKVSSRSGTMYVGPLTSPAMWKFYFCSSWETLLKMVEGHTSLINIPQTLWDICKR